LRDPKNGSPVVFKVYRADQTYHGPEISLAPDLIVGWEKGYRSSWETALGEIPATVIEDNKDEWRGDHCIAAELVPGVFLSNRKSKISNPWLGDVPVTLLHEFGVPPAKDMRGRSIF
jgi:predicted AlkP superfamily phosphohydrolase/phosphomutase